jgi:hypothetical protein
VSISSITNIVVEKQIYKFYVKISLSNIISLAFIILMLKSNLFAIAFKSEVFPVPGGP